VGERLKGKAGMNVIEGLRAMLTAFWLDPRAGERDGCRNAQGLPLTDVRDRYRNPMMEAEV